jgi:hypothetical protein
VVGIEPDKGQQLANARAAITPRRKAGVDLERLTDDLLDRHPRVERGVRVLAHQLDVTPGPPQVPS